MKILIIDDEKDIVSALSIYLKSDGYQVYKAYNGKEVAEIIKKKADIKIEIIDGKKEAAIIASTDLKYLLKTYRGLSVSYLFRSFPKPKKQFRFSSQIDSRFLR